VAPVVNAVFLRSSCSRASSAVSLAPTRGCSVVATFIPFRPRRRGDAWTLFAGSVSAGGETVARRRAEVVWTLGSWCCGQGIRPETSVGAQIFRMAKRSSAQCPGPADPASSNSVDGEIAAGRHAARHWSGSRSPDQGEA